MVWFKGLFSVLVMCLVVVCVVRWWGFSMMILFDMIGSKVSGMCVVLFVLGGVISIVWLCVVRVVVSLGRIELMGKDMGVLC